MIKGVIKIMQKNYDALDYINPEVIYEIVENDKEETRFLTIKEYKNENNKNCSINQKF